MFDFDNFDIVHRPFNKTFDVKSFFRTFDKFKFRTDHGVFRKEYRAAIQNGVVLDHIQAGKSMDIYKYLHLDELDCSVAIIKNARSEHMGRKDIIKIDSPLDLDLDVLGYIDSDVDARTIARTGARTIQLHTGGMCHLDAGMTR